MTERTELPDGIYLDLDFPAYLALDRVSSSSLTDMMESPAAYWARSKMNPDYEEKEETDAMKLGRAYHAARLEPDTFEELYVQELDLEDMPEEAYLSDTGYKAKLKELGLAMTKAGEPVIERAKRLEASLNDAGQEATIWHLERARWEEANADKTWLSRKAWGEIKRDAERIRMNPELEAMISGGAPEVSILWTDPDTGLKCKCRPDYLGPNFITHLKTWDLKSFGKPGNRAVVDTFQYSGHHRTGWFYAEGLAAMPGLEVRTPDGKKTKVAGELIDAWKSGDGFQTWFMFVRRQGIPDIRAREVMYFDLPKGIEEQKVGASTEKFARTLSVLGRKSLREVRTCMNAIAQSRELYGTKGEPWFPRDMIGRIEDADFSDWWLDSSDEPR